MLNSLFNNTQNTTPSSTGINGVRFNRPTGFVDEYGGNGELTGVSNWGSFFTGLNNLGEGYDVQDVQSIGGANPTGFIINRADPNGDSNVYQQRTLNINPDGTVSWADGSNWKSRTQQSQMGHFLSAGLPMLLAFAGGVSALGGAAGGAAGSGGLSGMDLAADAALGTGNNITTAGGLLNGATIPTATGFGSGTVGGSGLTPGTGTQGLQVGSGTSTGLGNTGLGSGVPAGAGETLGLPGSGLTLGSGGGTTAGGAAGGLGSLLNNVTSGGGNTVRNLIGSVLGSGNGSNSGGSGGNGISGLTDLFNLISNGTMYNKFDNLMDEIKQIYSPEGAYAKTLENRLSRADAASGRNSQYGPRLAQLMGSLGDSQARALQGLGGMMSNQAPFLNGAAGSGNRLLETGLNGLFDLIGNAGDDAGNVLDGIDWDNWMDIDFGLGN